MILNVVLINHNQLNFKQLKIAIARKRPPAEKRMQAAAPRIFVFHFWADFWEFDVKVTIRANKRCKQINPTKTIFWVNLCELNFSRLNILLQDQRRGRPLPLTFVALSNLIHRSRDVYQSVQFVIKIGVYIISISWQPPRRLKQSKRIKKVIILCYPTTLNRLPHLNLFSAKVFSGCFLPFR